MPHYDAILRPFFIHGELMWHTKVCLPKPSLQLMIVHSQSRKAYCMYMYVLLQLFDIPTKVMNIFCILMSCREGAIQYIVSMQGLCITGPAG